MVQMPCQGDERFHQVGKPILQVVEEHNQVKYLEMLCKIRRQGSTKSSSNRFPKEWKCTPKAWKGNPKRRDGYP